MILMVDNDPDFLFKCGVILEREGYKVVTADTRKEAEKIIEKVKPELLITEIMIENKDSGFVLCNNLKQRYPEVPIIIYTSVVAETGMKFELNTKGDKKWIKADALLEKGIDQEYFLKEVNRMLDAEG